MTSFDATNSVFIITDENESFLITAPESWIPERGEEPIDILNEILEVRSQNDIELQVKEFEKTLE